MHYGGHGEHRLVGFRGPGLQGPQRKGLRLQDPSNVFQTDKVQILSTPAKSLGIRENLNRVRERSLSQREFLEGASQPVLPSETKRIQEIAPAEEARDDGDAEERFLSFEPSAVVDVDADTTSNRDNRKFFLRSKPGFGPSNATDKRSSDLPKTADIGQNENCFLHGPSVDQPETADDGDQPFLHLEPGIAHEKRYLPPEPSTETQADGEDQKHYLSPQPNSSTGETINTREDEKAFLPSASNGAASETARLHPATSVRRIVRSLRRTVWTDRHKHQR